MLSGIGGEKLLQEAREVRILAREICQAADPLGLTELGQLVEMLLPGGAQGIWVSLPCDLTPEDPSPKGEGLKKRPVSPLL